MYSLFFAALLVAALLALAAYAAFQWAAQPDPYDEADKFFDEIDDEEYNMSNNTGWPTGQATVGIKESNGAKHYHVVTNGAWSKARYSTYSAAFAHAESINQTTDILR